VQTPLSAEILDSWSLPSQPKHRLTVPEMVAQQAALGRKVGLLLDLSNHDCLYAADIPPSLTYTHIQLVAKELPPPEFVDAVVAVARAFWAQHPDEYIAVHCAYGGAWEYSEWAQGLWGQGWAQHPDRRVNRGALHPCVGPRT
jgi:hypothetical protein